MFEVLWFILNCILEFLNMLFSIDVGVCSLGVVMCVCFILFPTIIMFVDFLKASTGDVSLAFFSSKKNYVGKHEYVGRHSKAYFDRRR